LFFHGVEDYEFTPLFVKLIKESKVFLDVGANIGLFSVIAEKVNPEVKILAFEPSVGPLHYLKLNVKANKLKNVVVVDRAVAELDGELTFYDVVNRKYHWVEHNLNGSNSLQNRFGKEKSSSYPVKTTTLETALSAQGLDKVDLIKLDTECTEHFILQSSLALINRDKPIILCEVYPEISAEVEKVLKEMIGYHLYHIHSDTLQKIDDFDQVSESKERNFLFVPEHRQGFLSYS
jgi:FkbM family methyltransferase